MHLPRGNQKHEIANIDRDNDLLTIEGMGKHRFDVCTPKTDVFSGFRRISLLTSPARKARTEVFIEPAP